MEDITVKSIESVAPYSGPHEIPGIGFRHIREALGVTAWGMNVLDFAPNTTGYPEHDHVGDGQEEVYVVLRGAVTLEAGGASKVLNAGDFARVAPHVKRKLITTDAGAQVLAIGATPGQAFTPQM